MKQIITLLSIFAIFVSCGGSSDSSAEKVEIPHDSVQLRIAVMPTIDCLPVYLAATHGFFFNCGIDVALLPYEAQMDCDTAIMRGHANAIVTDLVRAKRMKDEGLQLEYITATEASWQLLTNHAARIKQLRQLDDKMLAMTRFSATHLLSDKLVDSVGLKPERVFRIQVNDLNVRLGMLGAGIMDALLLPEPQATAARNRQALVLFDSRKSDERYGVIAFGNKAATKNQVEAFKKAYNMACDSINNNGFAEYRSLIKQFCHAQKETIDSLPHVHFHHASAPRNIDIQKAENWLKRKEEDKDNVEKQGL